MARAKTAKERKPKPRQGYLEGMDFPSIPAIDKAADAYVETRNERMSLQEPEAEKKAILKALMVKHGLQIYTYDEKEVYFGSEPDVKVRKKKVESLDKSLDKELKNGHGE